MSENPTASWRFVGEEDRFGEDREFLGTWSMFLDQDGEVHHVKQERTMSSDQTANPEAEHMASVISVATLIGEWSNEAHTHPEITRRQAYDLAERIVDFLDEVENQR
jgi:hypothetical protein